MNDRNGGTRCLPPLPQRAQSQAQRDDPDETQSDGKWEIRDFLPSPNGAQVFAHNATSADGFGRIASISNEPMPLAARPTRIAPRNWQTIRSRATQDFERQQHNLFIVNQKRLLAKPVLLRELAEGYDKRLARRREWLVNHRWRFIENLFLAMHNGTEHFLQYTSDSDSESEDDNANYKLKTSNNDADPVLDRKVVLSTLEKKEQELANKSHRGKVRVLDVQDSLFRATQDSALVSLPQFIRAIQIAFEMCDQPLHLISHLGTNTANPMFPIIVGVFRSTIAFRNVIEGNKIHEYDLADAKVDIRDVVTPLKIMEQPLISAQEQLSKSFRLYAERPGASLDDDTISTLVSHYTVDIETLENTIKIVHTAKQTLPQNLRVLADTSKNTFVDYILKAPELLTLLHISNPNSNHPLCPLENQLSESVCTRLAEKRRFTRNQHYIRKFLTRLALKQESKCMASWRHFVAERVHQRDIITRILMAKCNASILAAYESIQSHAMAEVASELIQCAYRCYAARAAIFIHRQKLSAAVEIQRIARGFIAITRRENARDVILEAVVYLQRFRRRVLAKRRIYLKFMAIYRGERDRIGHLRVLELHRRDERAALVIQCAWHVFVARQICREVKRSQRERDRVLLSMESWEHDQVRLKVKQRYAFIVQYNERVLTEEQRRLRAIEDEKVKKELRRRKRGRKVQEWQKSISDARDVRRERSEAALQEFDENFTKDFEGFAENYNKYVSQVVTERLDIGVAEMALTRGLNLVLDPIEVRREVKKKCKHIEKEVRKSDEYHDKKLTLPMAQDQIIEKYMSEMEIKLKEDHANKRLEKEAELKNKLLKDEEAICKLPQETAKLKFASKLQRLWRSYCARRSLGVVINANIFKRYDASSHSAYYVNLVTGNAFWKKPAFLGGWEIEFVDEWVACLDSIGDTYYLNPHLKNIKYTDGLELTVME